jgi:DNA-binding response OmpR family regulator
MGVSSLTGKTIVVCEDNQSVLELVDRALRDEGVAVRMAIDAPRAMRACLTIPPPSMLILDVFLIDVKGLDVYRLLRKCGATLPVLLMTGYPIEYVEIDRIELGLSLMEKPFDAESLTRHVSKFLENAPIPDPAGEPVIRIGEVAINLRTHSATRGERSFRLTDRELDVLFHLLVMNGRNVKNETLIEAYWGNRVSSVSKEFVTTLRTLRAKMRHQGETELIEKTFEGWKMLSPVEDLQRRLTWDWMTYRKSLGLGEERKREEGKGPKERPDGLPPRAPEDI